MLVAEIRELKKFWPQFGVNLAGGFASSLLFAAVLTLLAFIVFSDASPIAIGAHPTEKKYKGSRMATKPEATSKLATMAAFRILHSNHSSKAAKSAAGSALSQRLALSKTKSSIAATAASKVLRSENASKSSKTAAGSALTQRLNGRK